MRIALARAVVVPAGLFALVLASRLPFVTHVLWAWDSVLYARALEQGFHVDFDLADQRPQPPGYLLYVASAAALRGILGDSNAALVAVSVLASALGALAVFLVARRFCGTGTSLFVAAGFAANPLVWTYGEVAYPYSALALLSVTLAGLFWAVRPGPAFGPLLASFAFGLLSGFRQDLLLLLGTLWLWLVWPRAWRVRALAAALVACGALVWLVPTVMLSEGFETYLTALTQQGGAVQTSYSVPAQGLAALSYNLRFTVYALGWGLLAFAVILAGLALGALLYRLRTRSDEHLTPSRGFFLAWVGPGLLFYVAVHIGEWGYVLSVLPALYVLAGALLARPVRMLRGPAGAWGALGAAVALAPALLFLAGTDRFSAAALARHDRAVVARVDYVRAHFPPDRTILVTREDFLTIRYYLPEYRTWLYDTQPYRDARKRKHAMRATTLVLFTRGLTPRQSLDVRYAQAADGVSIRYVSIEPGAVLEFYGDGFQVREQR